MPIRPGRYPHACALRWTKPSRPSFSQVTRASRTASISLVERRRALPEGHRLARLGADGSVDLRGGRRNGGAHKARARKRRLRRRAHAGRRHAQAYGRDKRHRDGCKGKWERGLRESALLSGWRARQARREGGGGEVQGDEVEGGGVAVGSGVWPRSKKRWWPVGPRGHIPTGSSRAIPAPSQSDVQLPVPALVRAGVPSPREQSALVRGVGPSSAEIDSKHTPATGLAKPGPPRWRGTTECDWAVCKHNCLKVDSRLHGFPRNNVFLSPCDLFVAC